MNRRRMFPVIVGTALVCAMPRAQAAAPFDETLSLHGISFRVTSANSATANSVTVQPTGLEIDNSPVVWPAEGTVVRAEVADLNADLSPEIYVFVRGPGPDERMSLVAYSANKKKSMSMIYLPPLDTVPNADRGYCGHDDMATLEGVLAHRFPICIKEGDRTVPSGKMRQLQYKLVPGEAGWGLKLDRMLEF
jgi:hypothetical protein